MNLFCSQKQGSVKVAKDIAQNGLDKLHKGIKVDGFGFGLEF